MSSPLESLREWYDLPAVAEAAPLEFLRAGWGWLVKICEEFHTGYHSTVVYRYSGSCVSLDERPYRPDAPILTSFCEAIDAGAATTPMDFVEVTRHSWSSENAVVHRLLVRGLCLVARENPQIVLQYLSGDRRRFLLGTYEEHEQSDSIKLIHALAPKLSEHERRQLEEMILSWSMYHDGVELSDEQKEWNREARLRLLDSIPSDLLSPRISSLVQSEKASLPNWNQKSGGVRSGFVRQIPPVSKEEMLTAANEKVLSAICASQEPDRSKVQWTEVEGGWEEPGGPSAAGRELAELAKQYPHRVIELIYVLVANGQEVVAAQPMHNLADSNLTDEDVFSLVRGLTLVNPRSEEIRSNIGYVLYRRCKEGIGLPDDICGALGAWLSMPWDSSFAVTTPSDTASETQPPQTVASILWSTAGGILDTDRSFWPLLAITQGYLLRSPPETERWLTAIEQHLDRDIAERTWAAYCSELRWVRLKGCELRRESIIAKLFNRFPGLINRREGVRLVAHVSNVMSPIFVQGFLNSLRVATGFIPRQAFGELLTLIAYRDGNHSWARERLNSELAAIEDHPTQDEAVAVGIAFAAAQLWDLPECRTEASRVLSRLIPNATHRIAQAITTVFWAREDFAVDDATKSLLQALAEHPRTLAAIDISDLFEHLTGLVPHNRELVLGVCKAILKSGRQESDLFEAGPQLVKIAMTLQRFPDTRTQGLTLLEDLLRLGLDDAFRVLREIDIQPAATPRREPRKRRRRGKSMK